jgi:hypothetical protein
MPSVLRIIIIFLAAGRRSPPQFVISGEPLAFPTTPTSSW